MTPLEEAKGEVPPSVATQRGCPPIYAMLFTPCYLRYPLEWFLMAQRRVCLLRVEDQIARLIRNESHRLLGAGSEYGAANGQRRWKNDCSLGVAETLRGQARRHNACHNGEQL